jgi:hypothetical protein
MCSHLRHMSLSAICRSSRCVAEYALRGQMPLPFLRHLPPPLSFLLRSRFCCLAARPPAPDPAPHKGTIVLQPEHSPVVRQPVIAPEAAPDELVVLGRAGTIAAGAQCEVHPVQILAVRAFGFDVDVSLVGAGLRIRGRGLVACTFRGRKSRRDCRRDGASGRGGGA